MGSISKDAARETGVVLDLMEATPDAMLLVAADGRIALANRNAERLFGYGRGALVGQSVEVLVPEASRGEHVTHRRAFVASPRSRPMGGGKISSGLRRDGSTFPVEISLSPIALPSGLLVCVAIRDGTQHAERVHALSSSELRYRTLVDNATDGIFISDAAGRYLDVNAAGCAMLGYSRAELLSLTVADVVTSAELERVSPELGRLPVESSVATTWTFERKDGSTFIGEVNARQLPDGRRLAFLRDITQRVHVEQALRRSRGSLAEAQALAGLGSWELDLHTDRLEWSDQVYLIFEVEPGEPLSYARFLSMVHPEDRDRVAKAYERSVQSGEVYQVEHRLCLPNGKVKYLCERGRTEYDPQGRPTRSMGTVLDITDRVRAEHERLALEEQLFYAQKMDALGSLAGGIAHDFNNILTAVLGNLEIAEQDLAANHPVQTTLHEVKRAAERARQLVGQILAFSRRQAKGAELIDLAATVQEVLTMVRVAVPATIEIVPHIEPNLPRVPGDDTQLYQVVLNLCTNAWQAIPSKRGRIDIRLERGTAEETKLYLASPPTVAAYPHDLQLVCLTVRDTGVGMSEQTRARIFDPFFTTKVESEGTGLGLSVVRGIVELHGGRITVESTIDVGTTFRVLLPARPIDEPPPAAPEPSERRSGGGRQVLVLDDEAAIVGVFRRILEQVGFEVAGFTSPQRAVAAYHADPEAFAAVVVDQNMPQLDGLEVAQHILSGGHPAPVVVVSGFPTEELRLRAARLGVVSVLQKPVGVQELQDTLLSTIRE